MKVVVRVFGDLKVLCSGKKMCKSQADSFIENANGEAIAPGGGKLQSMEVTSHDFHMGTLVMTLTVITVIIAAALIIYVLMKRYGCLNSRGGGGGKVKFSKLDLEKQMAALGNEIEDKRVKLEFAKEMNKRMEERLEMERKASLVNVGAV